MGSAQDQFAEAFRELRSAFGVPIKIGSITVDAVVAESALGRELVAGGFQQQGEFTARVLLSDLLAAPKPGDLIHYKGQPYRIDRVAIQPGHPVAELSLRPAKR